MHFLSGLTSRCYCQHKIFLFTSNSQQTKQKSVITINRNVQIIFHPQCLFVVFQHSKHCEIRTEQTYRCSASASSISRKQIQKSPENVIRFVLDLSIFRGSKNGSLVSIRVGTRNHEIASRLRSGE